MNRIVSCLLTAYKTIAGPTLKMFFSGGCRFTPSCSEYARDAIARFGIIKGISLSINRILRCNPLNKSAGFDPVK